MASSPPQLTLYGSYISSCTARLRIALALQGLSYTPVYVDLAKNEQRSAAYAAINPSRSLPTLVVAEGEDEKDAASGGPAPPLRITQSAAALEYLAEEGPLLQKQQQTLQAGAPPPVVHRLMPATAAGRARMRTLVQILVADVQPRTSNNCREAVVDLVLAAAAGADKPVDGAAIRRQWSRDWHIQGLRAYEALLGEYSGSSSGSTHSTTSLYSLGDSITLADVCLVPVVWNAVEKWGIRLEDPDGDGGPGLDGVARVYGNMMKLAAVRDSHWSRQPDCPEHLRTKE